MLFQKNSREVTLRPEGLPVVPKKYGVELQQVNLRIVLMTIRYADELCHPQFFGLAV